MTLNPPCSNGHESADPAGATCHTCEAHQIARCKPGYLNKLHQAAQDNPDAQVIYDDTIAALHNTATRLYWGWHNGTARDGLEQLTLISQGHKLLTAVQGHTALPDETKDAIHALFTVTTAAGLNAGITTPTPNPQLV